MLDCKVMKKVILFLALFLTVVFFIPKEIYAVSAGPLNSSRCGESSNRIDTAIGCIPVFDLNGPQGFMSFVLGWGVGVAGGIAFLLILFGGFQIMTSSGDPGKLKAGKELVGAAISGLLLLIFSTFILRIVGVDILNIFS